MQHDRAVTCRFLRRSIDRNEYKGLLEFLTAKGLKIRNLVETAAAENEARKRAMGLDGSSSDDEMPQRGPADSNDEDSPDEDFVAPKDDSSDDDDDDDDEDGSGSDDNEEEAKPKKKKVLTRRPRCGAFDALEAVAGSHAAPPRRRRRVRERAKRPHAAAAATFERDAPSQKKAKSPSPEKKKKKVLARRPLHVSHVVSAPPVRHATPLAEEAQS